MSRKRPLEMCSSERDEEHFNRISKPILNKVYEAEVKLESAHNRKRILNDLLREFAKYTATQDHAFDVLFNNYLHTGSAFEGLQLIEAADVELYGSFKLKRPLDEIIERRPDKNKLALLAQFFDNEGYLISDKVRFWCQSLVDHFINVIGRNNISILGVREIQASNSGPARTLEIRLFNVAELEWISVDLVPVFVVTCDGHLKKIRYQDSIVSSQLMKKCILVPKPLRHSYIYRVEDHKIPILWRFHFPEAEESIIYNRGCLKTLIKLVKCLRNKENFSLPSYFIKMVAFHMVKEHPDPAYFDDFYLGIRFLQMVAALLHHLERQELSHIFYPNFNLFERLDPSCLAQIANRVRKIYNELRRNPNSIKSFFRCSRYE